jgi:hypothetical protein
MVGVIGLALAPLVHGFPGTRRHPHRPDTSSTSGRKAAGLWGRRRIILLCTEANLLTFQAASSSSASRQELLELALLIFWPATISLRDASFQCNNVPANSSLSLVQETGNTHTHTHTRKQYLIPFRLNPISPIYLVILVSVRVVESCASYENELVCRILPSLSE